ncbi:MAG: hypothetical protein M1830_004883 [Pleopsidium flavum]|nr:MAG: hypothetical protein M1830_004883 [Pleopsidium flavum]
MVDEWERRGTSLEFEKQRRPDLATRATNSNSSTPIAAGRSSATPGRFGGSGSTPSQLGVRTALAIGASEQLFSYWAIQNPGTIQAVFFWIYCPPERRNASDSTNTSPRLPEPGESTEPISVEASAPCDTAFVEESQPSNSNSSSSYGDREEANEVQEYMAGLPDGVTKILTNQGEDARDRRKVSKRKRFMHQVGAIQSFVNTNQT